MNCTNCGATNPVGQRFCDECGSALAAACPNCGQSNRAGARFCGSCGTTLGQAPAPSALDAPGRAAASAEAGTQPPNVAERRFVSVLFADLVGFTPMSEGRDAEDVRELLGRYFDVARTVIERHGGTVEKFIGDAVMAVWGTPVAHEDDAERAVRAALELITAVRGVGAGLEARGAVLTGEAAVTLGAAGQGMLAGDMVNTAARLQSVAPPGGVLVGESTVRAAGTAIEFAPAGDQSLKGKQAPVPAWHALRVSGERRGRARSDALEPPFVGREAELTLLKELLHASTRERRPRLVTVTGPGGIGKSRLAWELEKYVEGIVEDVYWHRGRSPAYGQGISFWALGEMVRQRARLAEGDDETVTRERIAATLAEYVPGEEDRRWIEPALLALLGVEAAPPGGRDVLFAAWRMFFEHISRRGTTILLFEDLQWADSGLLDFIDHLLEWSRDVPMVVLALARPELRDRRPDFGTTTRHFHSVPLEPLREDEMRALLTALVPELPEAARQRILERADGIPLYAVETLRMLIADGRLEEADGVFRPVGDLGALAIPDSLRSLVAARLDGLSPADRGLVQDASVLGQSFTMASLAALGGSDEAALEGPLRGLVRSEILSLQADPRSPERGQYSFVQSVIREVAYGTLARRDRRRRHLAAARYFESLGDDELAGALANHFVAAYNASAEGEEADAVATQARLALRGAAERAIALGAPEQAVDYLRQALEVTADPGERASLLLRTAESGGAGGLTDDAVEHAREAVDLYRTMDDTPGSARATGTMAHLLMETGRPAEAIAALEGVLASVSELPALEAELLAVLSRAQMRTGAYAASVESADRALVVAELTELEATVGEAMVNKGSSLAYLGRWREGSALLAAAIEIAERTGKYGLQLRASNNLASTLTSDDPARGAVILRRAIDQARRIGDRSHYAWLAGTLANFLYYEGRDWEGGIAILDDVLDGRVNAADRARLLGIRLSFAIPRAEPQPSAVEEAIAANRAIPDVAWQVVADDLEGDMALASGDSVRSHEAFMRSYRAYDGNSPYPLDLAFRAALWSRRADLVREAGEILVGLPLSGRLNGAIRSWVRAGLAAVDGDRDTAVARYREAFQRMRELGQDYELARMELDAAVVLADVPELRKWADEEARAVLERVGAARYIAILDRALSSTSGSAPTPTSSSDRPTPRPAEASPR